MFAGADEDMNDFLTFAEVLKNHELFVGSEATDYGDHLTNLHKFEDELWEILVNFIHKDAMNSPKIWSLTEAV